MLNLEKSRDSLLEKEVAGFCVPDTTPLVFL